MDRSKLFPPPNSLAPVPASREERMWGMLCHLITLVALLGIPLANIVGPLVVWLFKKDAYPFVNDQGKEALNFQISITIYLLIAVALALTVVLLPVVVPLVPIILLFDIVMTIVAAIKANDGIAYRYPLTIRFIS